MPQSRERRDGQGSTTQLTDSAGAITDSYSYDVFGAPRTTTGTTSNDFRYTAQQDDRNANRGLYFLRARSYDPALGRFLQRDRLAFGNPYAYAGNNPGNLTDPSGLFPCWRHPVRCAQNASQAANHGIDAAVNAGSDAVSDKVLDYATDPYNIASGVQAVSLVALKIGCPLSETGVGLVACGLGTLGYAGATLYKWYGNCEKVRSGEYSPLQAKVGDIAAVLPLPGGIASKASVFVGGKLSHYGGPDIPGCDPTSSASAHSSY